MRQILPIISLFIVSCSNPSTQPDIVFTDIEIPEHLNLVAEEIPRVMDSIFSPNTMVCLDDMLFINDMGSKGLFHAIDLGTEQYVGNFGTLGKGPGELNEPFVMAKNEPDELQVFDINLKKVVCFPSRPDSVNNTYSKEYLLNGIEVTPSISVDGEDVYGLSIMKTGHRIFSYDSRGNYRGGMGELPIFERQPERILAMINYSNLRHHKGVFALGYYSVPFLQIFNSNLNEWILVSGPDDFKPAYRIRPNPGAPFAYTEETRRGFIDVKISDRFIYALYSGDVLFDIENFNYDKIYVFDHQGNPVKKISLSEGVLSFDVHKDRYIYGFQYGEEHRLLKFTIPDQL